MIANLSVINIVPNSVTGIYIKLRNIIEKALFVDVTPKFAIVKGQFINEIDILTASCNLKKSHLTKHVQDLYNLSIQYIDLKSLLYSNIGVLYNAKCFS